MVRLRLSARDARRAVITSVRAEVDCPKGTPGGKDNTTMFTEQIAWTLVYTSNIPNAIYLHMHDMGILKLFKATTHTSRCGAL